MSQSLKEFLIFIAMTAVIVLLFLLGGCAASARFTGLPLREQDILE